MCANDGTVLQECPVTAEPDFYTALDEVTEHRRVRIPSPRLDLQQRMALELRELWRAPEKPGCLANFLPLLRRLAGRGASPVLEMLRLAASGQAPLSLVVDPGWGTAGKVIQKECPLTDEQWLRLAQRMLPDRVRNFQATYRRRIAWLTLRRELECQAQARLPARAHIPRTAAFIDTLIESKAAASIRLVAHRSCEDREAA